MAFISLYAGAFIMIAHFAITPGLLSLQKIEAEENMERVLQALDRELHHLKTLCWDWAAWDETVKFVEERSEEYIRSNLPSTTFTDNNLSLIYIYDKEGSLIWGETRDPKTGKIVPSGLLPGPRLFKSNPLLLSATGVDDTDWPVIAGYYAEKPAPVMLVAMPIVSSENEGPSRGTMVMGRKINTDMVTILSKQTGVSFQLFSVPEESVSGIGQSIVRKITSKTPYIVDKMEEERIRIYATLPEITGKSSILVRAQVYSKIFEVGAPILRFSMISVIIAGMGILLLAYVLIKMSVLSPLAILTGHINDIENGGKPGNIPFLDRKDELGMLATAYNNQLQALAAKSSEISEINRRLEHDLLHRRRVERQLRESEKYYRSLLQSLHEDILVINEEQVVVDANREHANSVRLYTGKVQFRSCAEVFHAYTTTADHGYDKFLISRVFQTGQPLHYRLENATEDRKKASHLDVSLSPILDHEQMVTRVIMAVRDVTPETLLARHVNQFQKFEAVGTLAGGIAHEFNNILMSIQLNLELARMCRDLDDATREGIEVAYQASLRAKNLVNQILIFSRQEKQGKYPLSVGPLIKEGVKMLQPSLPENVKIVFHSKADSDTISASPDQVHQILVNLCTNAAQSMEAEGGDLTVSLETLTLDESNNSMAVAIGPGDYLALRVKDLGTGMSPDIQHRIFDPFFTLKKPGEGTGLGLSVVHGIVKELHGEIIVESQLGMGSLFTIFFPLITAEEVPDAEPLPEKRGKHKIFVVDDEQILLDTLHRGLTSMGYEVRTATSTEDALEIMKLELDDIDLVVTDVTMPGDSGLELAKRLFELKPRLPVILCTGVSNLPHRDMLKETGIQDIAMKPLNFKELDIRIRSILNKCIPTA